MSKQEGNGLSLEGLAQRLEALEHENERMRSENAELRDEVAELRGSGTPLGEVPAPRGSDRRSDKEVASEFAGQVSRRSLLSKAGAAAVAAVAAGTFLSPRQAKANHYADPIAVDGVQTHWVAAFAENDGVAVTASAVSNTNPAVEASNSGIRPAVRARNYDTGPGVQGSSAKGIGVWGTSDQAGVAGVYGSRLGDIPGPGVVGDGKGDQYAGVLGRNDTGTGVQGESAEYGYSGVYGLHTGTLGYGVYGLGKGTRTAGVLGRHQGAGYGGQFDGGRAQLWLVPKSTAGKPTGAHNKGEIYMDSAANLFVCTVGGNPGTWRRVTTTAV